VKQIVRSRSLAPALLALLVLTVTCQAAIGTVGTAPDPSPVAVASATPKPRFTPIPTETPVETPGRSVVPLPTTTPKPDFSKPPVPSTDEAGLVAQLTMVEKAIRDPEVKGAELVWYGHLQQLAYGQLADLPDLKTKVVGALPAEARASATAALDAGKELRKMHGAIPKQLPDWRIVEPPAPEVLYGFYKEAEQKFGVAWYYLAAINLIETRMGRIRGLSSAGAQGPMQFMPPTWAAYGLGGDVNEYRDAIMGAANYLKASGAPANMNKAIWNYNHSDFYVNAVKFYAEAMRQDRNAFRGFYGWQVYYPTEDGPVLLAVGWKKD
jgi:hypothetical protein